MSSTEDPSRYALRYGREHGAVSRNKAYYESLSALKRAHSQLFEQHPQAFTTFRPVVDTSVGFLEVVVRFPLGYSPLLPTLKRVYTSVLEEYGQGEFELTVTANVILESVQRVQTHRDPNFSSYGQQFSVYYGQDFAQLSSRATKISLLPTGTIPIRTSQDIESTLTRYCHVLEPTYIASLFDGILGQSSGVRVVAVINSVFILRRIGSPLNSQARIGYQTRVLD